MSLTVDYRIQHGGYDSTKHSQWFLNGLSKFCIHENTWNKDADNHSDVRITGLEGFPLSLLTQVLQRMQDDSIGDA